MKTVCPKGRVGSNPTLSAILITCKDLFLDLELYCIWRSTQAGRRGAPAKGVGRETGARVRIPPSPPHTGLKIPIILGFWDFLILGLTLT